MAKRATSPDDLTELRRRLDIMICLLLETGPEPSNSVAKKIRRLIGFGLTDSEVGAIVGKKANHVGSVRSRLKSKK